MVHHDGAFLLKKDDKPSERLWHSSPSSFRHRAPSHLQFRDLTCPVGVTVVFGDIQGMTFSNLLHFLCSHRKQSHCGISSAPHVTSYIIQITDRRCVYLIFESGVDVSEGHHWPPQGYVQYVQKE